MLSSFALIAYINERKERTRKEAYPNNIHAYCCVICSSMLLLAIISH